MDPSAEGPAMSDEYTRDDLIAICEQAIRPQTCWRDRDSQGAQRQVGEAWALLRAGCEFEIDHTMGTFNGSTVWVAITSHGFNWFEEGADEEFLSRDTFYLPSRARLAASEDRDWY